MNALTCILILNSQVFDIRAKEFCFSNSGVAPGEIGLVIIFVYVAIMQINHALHNVIISYL